MEKYKKAKRTLKELGEVISITNKALEDNKLTKKEITSIVKEWNDVIGIWK